MNALDEYLRTVGDEPVRWLAREVRSWGNEFSYSELAAAIEAGNLDDLIDWQERYADIVNEKLAPMWAAAIAEASKKATRGMTVLSDSNDYVRGWINTHGGELITRLSDESRLAVMNVILRGQGLRMAPRDIAKEVRPLIGLNDRQAAANQRYKQEILRRYLERGMNESKAAERAEKAALKYAGKQHRYRAETIVLTENAFAYNRGAHMGVSQSIADGYMGRCAMIWTTAGTNRVCSRCLALKDTVVGYTDELGVLLPPLHPRCRCAIMYDEVGTPRAMKPKPTINPLLPAAVATEIISPATPEPQTEPSGAPKYPRQEHFSTSDENAQATNPNFNLGEAFQINCQKCVPAYEMRMRGYEVVARPTFDINTDGFAQKHWSAAFENPQVERIPVGSGKLNIIERLKEWGDGARAEVYVEWADEELAHVFVAENRNNIVHFLDPQTGEIDVEYYFEYVKEGLTEILRIDNLELNEKNIKWCCKENK